MRQLSCKGLLILFINFCFFLLSASAQDSAKTVQRTAAPVAKKAPQTNKPVVKSAIRTVSKTSKQVPALAPTESGGIVQEPAKEIADNPQKVDPSLNGQYNDLLKYSWMQKEYKVINPGRLSAFWKSVNDTLRYQKKELLAANQKLTKQSKEIAQLKDKKVDPNSSISTAADVNSSKTATVVNKIEVLGMAIDTTTYNWMVWGIILVLALGFTGVLFTTTKNSVNAKHHKQLYEEVSTEYQAYRTKSKEKELKLARELQTERNTIEDLLAKKNEAEAIRKTKKG